MSDCIDTAGILIIGNEILSGKVVDINSSFLCRELNFLGMEVSCIITVPDDSELIGKSVISLSENNSWVFTSGGIGPTHDDITIPAIASAFDVPTVESPEIAEILRNHYKENLTEEHLRMALIPEGARLHIGDKSKSPQVIFRNIIIMPGIPELFKYRFQMIKGIFRQSTIHLAEILLDVDEGFIAKILDNTMDAYPDLLLGSYPVLWEKGYSLKLTLESRDPKYLKKSRDYLLDLLAKKKIFPYNNEVN